MTGSSEFHTTHWTILGAAAGPDRQQTLDYVYRAYAGPLRNYARRFGVNENDLDDVTHEFVLSVFSSDSLERADRNAGRFRSYIVAALRHFLWHRREKARAVKRGGGVAPLSLSLNPLPEGVPVIEEDERHFDEEWASALVTESLRQLDVELSHSSEDSPREMRDLIFREQDESYAEVAARLRITVPALKSRIFRLRRRFREIVRQEVSRTVTNEEECDEELRYLCEVLGANWHE